MRQTAVTSVEDRFAINGELTYKGRYWNGIRIEGLLMNSRMVQGIFDDCNPLTAGKWAYPDTGMWDAERNTAEFLEQMPVWREHGLLAFTLNLQGGSPEGYSQTQPWHNSAFGPDGSLKEAYMARLERILDRADQLGMIVILGYFYFGQDSRFNGERAIKQAAANATAWLAHRGYTNVIIEVANECDYPAYTQPILRADRIHELIELARLVSSAIRPGYRQLIGTSFRGATIPTDNVMAVADVLLIHGNAAPMAWIPEQIEIIRSRAAYRGQPIVNNEDDHFDFDQETNHLILSITAGVSWGYFDPGVSDYSQGYQCPPVQWGINTERKRQFFNKLKEITGMDGVD
ncbi:hypothetical protein [Paenibacillus koleovorans]|uniref:hypothetical protein n=1 Tax=Paenibacillus koleovorans TaxID=121608 RepID=UPI000FDA6BD0|nr:hypothetical protein [Paenibacillus koleovorans]